MIINAIQSCIKLITERNWDKVYWAFDLHGTILVPNYKAGQIPTEFYPHAKETLQLISKMKDVCLIMYTCSHPHEIQQYLEFFEKNNIKFTFVNENPEVINGTYGYYVRKFYFNVLFEDKAGFLTSEWSDVKSYIQKHYDFETGKWINRNTTPKPVSNLLQTTINALTDIEEVKDELLDGYIDTEDWGLLFSFDFQDEKYRFMLGDSGREDEPGCNYPMLEIFEKM